MEQHNSITTQTPETGCRFAKVLLLDDNTVDNIVNRKLIEETHFAATILPYESGMEVLNYLRNENPEELPQIIFLDILMPIMDGFRFLDEYAVLSPEIHSRIKIIMLSTSESFEHLNRANKNRFVYKFLNKPLNEMVLDAINF